MATFKINVGMSDGSTIETNSFTVPDGEKGNDATISVGTTTTGDAGTSASVTNSGTSSDAVLNFTIPKGDTGAAGADGKDGISVTSVTVTEV